jgi:hypothetical protein
MITQVSQTFHGVIIDRIVVEKDRQKVEEGILVLQGLKNSHKQDALTI